MRYDYDEIKRDHFFKIKAVLDLGVEETWEFKQMIEEINEESYNEGYEDCRESGAWDE